MISEEDVKKIEGLEIEFNGTIDHLKEKFSLTEKEVLTFYAAEDIVKHADFLDTQMTLEKMKIVGYAIGGLISFCGGGPPYHFCTRIKNDGSNNLTCNYRSGCGYYVFTPSLPEIGKEIEYGFIQCANPFSDKEIKWGLIGKTDDFDNFCDVKARSLCTIKKFPSRISPAKKEDIAKEFKKYLMDKNKRYANFGADVFKYMEPVAKELSDKRELVIMSMLGNAYPQTLENNHKTYVS